MPLDIQSVVSQLRKRPILFVAAISLLTNYILWQKLNEEEEYGRARAAENRLDNADRIKELRDNNRAMQEFIEIQYRLQIMPNKHLDSISYGKAIGH